MMWRVPLFDLRALVEAGQVLAYVVVTIIIFAECGLLIGFFLPGDSLLFTAGVLASQKIPGTDNQFFNIWLLSALCGAAAIVGPAVGYWFGRVVGERLYTREDSRFFKRRHLEAAHEFYDKHGGKALLLARFMPIVRTFAPIVAGAARMDYTRFVIYTLIGAAIWAVGVTWAGYFLGNMIPPDKVDNYLLPIVAVIVIVSVAPSVIHLWHERQRSRRSRAAQFRGDAEQADAQVVLRDR
jgi:membrane-associated protein